MAEAGSDKRLSLDTLSGAFGLTAGFAMLSPGINKHMNKVVDLGIDVFIWNSS